ncbi:MAG: YlaN family protein [Carnobacterium sp.]|jgi:uncharacterized protein YlaN (UPF0358 family)|uniref:UPF0358 protein ylaN n=2 Tax=Carnobacterium maltaromaticum TaxID=2751 RepID=K8E3G0_CARML|nr:YlaN family protein [Carnobacterium maltaromaticum]AOA01776.1 hypothetical protein BFC23_04420 [Carnobacterium maltaromaticum]KRN64785.1 hypothetical protein IV70_GL002732 [Carnobacterium maltaromaticum DSM 20342]KRN74024.1 hypothetical protein IV76_GL000150 [Carnobacterium maltaromaticum]KRN87530.1 hypothetical protein IV75_GL002237 [Carnobacterium maltaromaticum]MBC9808657.1 DUF1507 family protein [Carnobacterium maltaromaticum]
MNEFVQKQTALDILMADAEKIYNLINSQKQHLCLAQCPAFEEVVDTQMYGFSKEVDYAVKIGVLTDTEGHRVLSDLEKNLNDVYTEMYDEKKEQV